ncbi:ATP-dependent DNA ligase [Dactylosporangium vinaceum]|uniref:Probable DNA ligase n=1 Tax=Dactylosporangium vinaceum TaxID=53362 RepID=A0ABV5M7L7_9ACTN|nr:ATP-dependent DNA ligase [Dactylosporangium vinaceum]UAB95439.1 ATP-dependent DNA ligase [Dactylosporangium vinaceum]
MQFEQLASVSQAVAATSARNAKIDLLAAALRDLAASGDERTVAAGAGYLAGELRQRQTGVGYASLRDLPPPAPAATLTVAAVDLAFERMAGLSGKGSQAARRAEVDALFGAATEPERRLLVGLLSGELRQGAQAGLLADAVARAAELPATAVRRALLLAGDLKAVAADALLHGAEALTAYQLTVGRPLAPMLASSAPDATEALAATGTPAAADIKIDGVRIQVHKSPEAIWVYSRSLDDITARLPGVVAAVAGLEASTIVLDGEAVGVDPETGRALPFQETSSRAARRDGVSVLQPYFFDVLHLDGEDLLDRPAGERWAALERVVPQEQRVGRTMIETPEQAEAAFAGAVAAGHEGLVIKSAAAPYDVGRRGAAWVKVKPRHTLDLVVLAVEWGHGRRKGWLSNLHLGARDPERGGFVMLGKTFKGMTDEMLRWQTERLRALAVEESDWVVKVRPELVVEIAFDGVQTSPRYPGGVALRFARVLRYREDKRPDEADTIDAVRAIHRGSP